MSGGPKLGLGNLGQPCSISGNVSHSGEGHLSLWGENTKNICLRSPHPALIQPHSRGLGCLACDMEEGRASVLGLRDSDFFFLLSFCQHFLR